MGLAAALQDLDDRREVQESAVRIFNLLDRKSKIDPMADDGTVLSDWKATSAGSTMK